MSFDPDRVLSIGAVARRLGVAVPTLRSWERRYGLGASTHSAGGHRHYTPEDLARMRRMVSLTGDGVPPAVAAGLALREEDTAPSGRDGGGSGSLAVGQASPLVRGLSRDAARLDVDGFRRRVTAHIAADGVADTWSELLVPLLRSIGEAYERTPDRVIPIEHVATAGAVAALHTVQPAAQRGRLPAVLACAPDEQHSLPLEALRAALAEHDIATRFLGARLPADALHRSTEKLRPTTVVVWAQTAALARRVRLTEIADRCSTLMLAGPGWSRVRGTGRFQHPSSLHEAIRVVSTAGGPSGQ